MNVLVINGPNLSRLDIRDSSIYGDLSYPQLVEYITAAANDVGLSADIRQSDDEATIIGWLHEAADSATPVIINPAAFTHTSVAIRDALAGVGIPFVEIHLSNVHKREPFRHHSYFSDLAVGVIAGLGATGYRCALQFAIETIRR